MTYKRKTTGAQHAEGSQQKHRKSDNEGSESESERATSTSKSTEGNNSY